MKEDDLQEMFDKILEGHADAFGSLFREYLQPKLYKFALGILKDPQLAEDIVQDVFVYLFERDRYLNLNTKSLKSFEAYIFKTTRHRCLDSLRAQKHSRFLIGGRTLSHLKYAKVSEQVLERVQRIRQDKPLGKAGFLTLITRVLGTQAEKSLLDLILESSRKDQSYIVLSDEEFFNSQAADPYIPKNRHESAEEYLNDVFALIREKVGKSTWTLLREKYYHGKTFREISKDRQSPISTLQSQCKKGIEKIRRDATLYDAWSAYLELIEEDNL